MKLDWNRLPTDWIRKPTKGSFVLPTLKWRKEGAANISALMLFIVLAQKANSVPNKDLTTEGCCVITYDSLGQITGLSRSMISKGLDKLERLNLITRNHGGKRSTYLINDYKNSKWGKLPCLGLYDPSGKTLRAFQGFNLRKKVELNSLKLYLLYIAFRDNMTNYASISYDKICEYTGLTRNEISQANSFLVALELIEVRVEQVDSDDAKVNNKYRIHHIDAYRHGGTIGKAS